MTSNLIRRLGVIDRVMGERSRLARQAQADNNDVDWHRAHVTRRSEV